MAGTEESFDSSRDGARLVYERWTPQGTNPGTDLCHVVFFHGVNESADTVSVHRMAKAITDVGMVFCCLEQRGHGRSVGPAGTHGLVKNFDELCVDAIEFCGHIVHMYHPAQFVVAGHSMGGAVALHIGDTLVQDYRGTFIGEAVIAPALYGPPELRIGVLRNLFEGLAWMGPGFPIGPWEDMKLYDTGSGKMLNYSGGMRAGTISMFMNDLWPRTDKLLCLPPAERKGRLVLDFPLLVLCGKQDEVVPCQTMRKIIEGASTKEKQLIELEGRSHQPLAVVGWEEVLQHLVAWCKRAARGLDPLKQTAKTSVESKVDEDSYDEAWWWKAVEQKEEAPVRVWYDSSDASVHRQIIKTVGQPQAVF